MDDEFVPSEYVIRNGQSYRLKYNLTEEDAKSILEAMEHEGTTAEGTFYRIAKMLNNRGIRVSDVQFHSISELPKAGIGVKIKSILTRLGMSCEADHCTASSSKAKSVTSSQVGVKKLQHVGENKLVPYSGMQTQWAGLWYHAEYNGYSSASISLAQLRKFKGNVRIYMRKNKFYERGSNRPNYNFCIKDANSPTFTELGVLDDAAAHLYTQDEVDDMISKALEGTYTYDDLVAVMEGAVRDGNRGYEVGDVIVEDYL